MDNPRLLGDYELIRPLDDGKGNGLWIARHRELGVERLVRLIPAGLFTPDFCRIAGVASGVRHLLLNPILDIGKEEGTGRGYVVMEMISGHSLGYYLRSGSVVPAGRAIEIAAAAAAGVEALEKAGAECFSFAADGIFILDDGNVRLDPLGGGMSRNSAVAESFRQVLERMLKSDPEGGGEWNELFSAPPLPVSAMRVQLERRLQTAEPSECAASSGKKRFPLLATLIAFLLLSAAVAAVWIHFSKEPPPPSVAPMKPPPIRQAVFRPPPARISQPVEQPVAPREKSVSAPVRVPAPESGDAAQTSSERKRTLTFRLEECRKELKRLETVSGELPFRQEKLEFQRRRHAFLVQLQERKKQRAARASAHRNTSLEWRKKLSDYFATRQLDSSSNINDRLMHELDLALRAGSVDPDASFTLADGKTYPLLVLLSKYSRMIDTFVNAGADVDAIDDKLTSPGAFFYLARSGRDEIDFFGGRPMLLESFRVPYIDPDTRLFHPRISQAELLLDSGCRTDVTDPDGMNAAHYAGIWNAKVFLRRLMLSGFAGATQKNNAGETPYALAVRNGSREAARILEEFGARTPVSPADCAQGGLLTAIIDCNPDRVSAALDAGAKLDFIYGNRLSVLQNAVVSGDRQVVGLLLERGAGSGGKNGRGGFVSPLVLAVGAEKPDIFALLLEKGASWKPTNSPAWMTPVSHIVSRRRFDPENAIRFLELLLKHGWRIDAPDRNRETALMLACRNWNMKPEVVAFLVKNGADPEWKNPAGQSALSIVRRAEIREALGASADSAPNGSGREESRYRPFDSLNLRKLPGVPAGWLNNVEEALEKAKKEKKKVLVLFSGSDWCGPCIALRRDVLDGAEFRNLADRHFIPVLLDSPRKNPLSGFQKQYLRHVALRLGHGGAVPSVYVLSADGRVIRKTVGYRSPASSFLAELRKAAGQ